MNKFSQGDVIKVDGRKNYFLIVSNNTFISYTGMFHISPIVNDATKGPLHIEAICSDVCEGTAICEQIQLINPEKVSCKKAGRLSYDQVMNISDAIQGIFEYD